MNNVSNYTQQLHDMYQFVYMYWRNVQNVQEFTPQSIVVNARSLQKRVSLILEYFDSILQRQPSFFLDLFLDVTLVLRRLFLTQYYAADVDRFGRFHFSFVQ